MSKNVKDDTRRFEEQCLHIRSLLGGVVSSALKLPTSQDKRETVLEHLDSVIASLEDAGALMEAKP